MLISSLLRTTRTLAAAGLLGLGLASMPALASGELDKATTEALESYFDFVDYHSGTIASEQIPAEDWKKFHVLDVRDAAQYAKEHIPGAVNIEWRRVFAARDQLPRDRTLLVYCNTSSFSGQVAMALRIAGFENVRLLHGGFNEWKARGGLEAHARAQAAKP